MNWTAQLVASVQARLAELGYYRLNIDGVAGVGTRNALTAFKASNGLRERDYPGPITLERLFSKLATPAPQPVRKAGEPLWLTEARRLLGTRETPGTASNPRIMDWARGLDQWYPGDDVPWCGLFVAHCLNVGAPNEAQPTNRLGAREWLKFGEAAAVDNPVLGSVCVLWRVSPASWQGHVFFVTGQSPDAIRGIGGNQSDAVTEAWFPRSRVLGCRVPTGYTGPTAPTERTGSLSLTEA